MKKHLSIVSIVLLFAIAFSGCGKSSNSEKQNSDGKSSIVISESKQKSMTQISNDATDLWNEVICEVSSYSKTGRSSTGQTLDIEFVISNMDKYLDKVKENKEIIDNLGNEYNDIKDAYNKMLDKAIVICDHLKEETPKSNTALNYQSDIELFKQYFDDFYKAVLEKDK